MGSKGFSVFKGLIDKLGLEERFQEADDKFTIFTAGNEAFRKLPFDINKLDNQALMRLVTKHFLKGAFNTKSLPIGPVQTMNGESITVSRDGNGKVRIITNSGEAKLKIANIRTKWGIVHVIDKVFL